jgi:hypothetical protein
MNGKALKTRLRKWLDEVDMVARSFSPTLERVKPA